MKGLNAMFRELEAQVKARLAGAGEDWHTPGYLTRRGRKHGSGLTLCDVFVEIKRQVSIQHSSCAQGGF